MDWALDWVSLGRNLLDDDAEWVTLLRHSLDNHPCERKVSETSFTLGKSLKFIPLGRRRLQFFAITNFIRKPYFPRHQAEIQNSNICITQIKILCLNYQYSSSEVSEEERTIVSGRNESATEVIGAWRMNRG